MRKIYILSSLLFLIISIGCNKSSHQKKEIQPEKPNSKDTINSIQEEIVLISDFNPETFKLAADSLLTEILRDQIQMTYEFRKLDSLIVSSDAKTHFLTKDAIIKYHLFEMPKGYKRFSLRIIEVVFDNVENTEKLLLLLNNIGSKRGSNGFPGLTYTNDYVVRSRNKIFWINSSCSYAYFNHMKITNFMIKSISQFKDDGNFECKCGLYCKAI
jgi:hypothetical protein